MKRRRVVVSGMGTVNAAGCGSVDFTQALRQGRSGIGPVSLFDTALYRTHLGGEVRDFRPKELLPRGIPRRHMSRCDLMAMVAAFEALGDAGLNPLPQALQKAMGVVIGGGAGGMLECEEVYRRWLEGKARPSFAPFASFGCAATADHLAATLGLMGPKTTFMTACSSGATAIGYACDLIRDGYAEVMLAGGAEPLCRITYSAFNALQAVDAAPCRPFDKNRQGLNLGEGAAILVLEEAGHALRRGAVIYGEVLGCGVSCDAHHMTAPDPEGGGAVLAMSRALADGGVSPQQVDYINAHGTATPTNDPIETKAIKTLFGPHAVRLAVSSTKAITGHTLGAAGAIEAVVSLLAIHHRFIPPTLRHEEPDPQCDLDYVCEGARDREVDIVLSNSFAFGGNNTALLFGRYREGGHRDV